MMEHQENLTLRQLNQYTQAWVEGDYHQKSNRALKGQIPIDCYLNHQNVGRDCPDSEQLRRVFRRQATRKQRRSDGTISLEGKRFEIPNAYHALIDITVQYAVWDLSVIDMIDPDTASILTPLYPQNKSANANGLRRQRIVKPQEPELGSSPTPPLLQKLLNEYAATGLPQGYLPKMSWENPNEQNITCPLWSKIQSF